MGLKIVPMYKFIAAIMLYSILGFVLFTGVYAMMGMKKNFNVGDAPGSNLEHAIWHSWTVQSTAMGEVTPKTREARIAQGIHLFLAWMPMIVLLAPWNIQQST